MGLLDDAIKEHLELKRRRGADPTEVDQLEREALGPVRRRPEPTDEALLEDEPAGQGGEPMLYDDEAGHDYAEPSEPAGEPALADEGGFVDERGATEQPLHESFQGGEHEPFPEDESERGWSHEPAFPEEPEHEPFPQDESERDWSHEPVSEAPQPAPPESRPEPPSQAGQETVEYDVEAEHGEGGAQEDPLEETPEFLQDTPDHDRLWFEQRPPRDFDFDK